MLAMTVVASAQAPPPAPPASVNVQINTQFLNDLMRSAIIFNGMVQGLNVHQALHDSGVASDGRATSAQRAAAVLGAGAGAGMAVGGMTGGQKGAVIGAIAGASGAYVIDQIVQHQAAKARQANADNYRDNFRDNPQPNDREPQHFKERVPPPPMR
jgi:hypothetical protein